MLYTKDKMHNLAVEIGEDKRDQIGINKCGFGGIANSKNTRSMYSNHAMLHFNGIYW